MTVSLCNNKNRLLSEEAFVVYSSCMYRPSYDKYKEKMEAFLNDRFVKIFICEIDRITVGLVVLKFSGPAAEIVGIAVHREFRGCGIGKTMIQNVIETEELESVTAQTDDDAVGFYRKCGFKDERTVKEYPDGIVIRYNCTFNKGFIQTGR